MKHLAIILASLAIIITLSIPAAFFIGMGFARHDGANFYEVGCVNGVAYTSVAALHKGTRVDSDKLSMDCYARGQELRERGYLR